MRPAVAVGQFVSRYAWIIDANDQAPPGHGIRTTVNTLARSRRGARRLTAPNHVGGRKHDLQVVCPMYELLRRLQHAKATRSLRDMKIGWRNAPRGRCQGLGNHLGIVRTGACLDCLHAVCAAVTRKEAKRPLRKRVWLCNVNTGSRAHLVRPAIADDTGHR